MASCDYIQFDEPMWTESPEDSVWSAKILNELIDSLPRVRIALHVCGGNPHRKAHLLYQVHRPRACISHGQNR